MNIKITKISDDKLTKKTWGFSFSDFNSGLIQEPNFRLSFYIHEIRQTSRHGWKNKKSYDAQTIDTFDPTSGFLVSGGIWEEAKELILKKIAENMKFLGWEHERNYLE